MTYRSLDQNARFTSGQTPNYKLDQIANGEITNGKVKGACSPKPEVDWVALVEEQKDEYALYKHVTDMLEEAIANGTF